jgi:hypothetical protein
MPHLVAGFLLPDVLSKEPPPLPPSMPTGLGLCHALGNYGEVFERNVGQGSPLKLERGVNQQWLKGGLMYSPHSCEGELVDPPNQQRPDALDCLGEQSVRLTTSSCSAIRLQR